MPAPPAPPPADTPPPPAPPPLLEMAPPVPAPAPAPEPLAGVSDGSMFLRSPDNGFVLLPGGRLQVDGYAFRNGAPQTPNNTFLLKRARFELSGWIGGWAFFTVQGDFASAPPAAPAPAAPANIATTDDFVALAPFGNIAVLQVGQYDAPFTLENRTSDKYFDFIERSITVRAFGAPSNKEAGAMVHGFNEDRNFHYSAGVFNGDGQNFRNVDKKFDAIGRAWVAPLSFLGQGPLHDVTIGGSFWTGDRNDTLAPANQTTMGGFTFLNFASSNLTVNGMANTPVQFRQVGRLKAFAGELNAPINHKFGVRGEFVWKHSPLSAESIMANGRGTILGGANLKGWSSYGEVWYWALGDDRIVGDQQAIGALPRFKKFGVKPVQDGVMLALRFEYLNEDLTEEADAAALGLGHSAVGKTKVMSLQAGVNYWHSKRFRATFNYGFNRFSGTTAQITGLADKNVHEFLMRLGIAL
jgi:phosphate-selective porin